MTILYGDFQGFTSSSLEAYPISYSGAGLFNNTPLAREMMELLPSYYWLGPNNRKIMELIAVILAQYSDKIEDLQDQFFVHTATWGLVYWEQLVDVPVNGDNLNYEARRVAILNKLRDCSSEKCFVGGLQDIIGGKVIVTLLNPVTHPYQIDIELRSTEVTFPGPQSAPTATAAGPGPLNGDYTYKVTYEFPPAVVPQYIVTNPDSTPGETSSGVSAIRTNEVQEIRMVGVNEVQTIEIAGVGTYEITFDGEETGATLDETSTAADVVGAINGLLITPTNTYGPFSVSTPNPAALVTDPGGVTIVFDGGGVQYRNIPPLQVTSATGTITDTVIEVTQGTRVSGGTYTITYDNVWDQTFAQTPQTTAVLPYNAPRSQIEDALQALPNAYPGTFEVLGGPLPEYPVTITWSGQEKGFPQSTVIIDSSDLTGGGFYEANRIQAGDTSYGDSESNTVTAVNNSVILNDVPISPDGPVARNIYRKKNTAPYNEYRYVGRIGDNITKIFIDNVPDEDLSETQKVTIDGSGTYKIRFDNAVNLGDVDTTTDLTEATTSTQLDNALEALTTASYPTIEVEVTGSTADTGLEIKFNGGDVEGKDVPQIEVIDTTGTIEATVETTGPRKLTEQNSAFTYTFQRALEYIYNTKPAHIHVHELRSAAFRASINRAGDPV